MPVPFLIIDGYNLLHAAGLARPRYGPGDLERCRNRLLGYLRRHLPPAERHRTTVVFDAGDAPADMPRRATLDGMAIVFATRGGDADSEIEALIAAHSAPRQVRVVSSDHRLQKAARRRRSAAVDSEDFLAALERRGPVTEDPQQRGAKNRAGPKYGGAVPAAETEHWLAVFGDAVPATATPRVDSAPHGHGAGVEAVAPSGPAAAVAPAPAPPARPAPDEVAFWQARVDELLDGTVDQPRPPAENRRG